MVPNTDLIVSAVVVDYRAGDHLAACLRSLRAEGVDEIVVADNDPAGSPDAAARADPSATWFSTGSNLGFGGGANRAAERTRGDAILAVNPDVEVEPGAIKAMVAVLDRDPAVGIVGPRIEDADGQLYSSPRRFPSLADALGHAFLGLVAPSNRFTRRYRMLDWDHSVAAQADWVSGSCMLVRRACWDELAGFDEAYFMYAEDVDLCWRAHEAGWRVVYEPAARVLHIQGASTEQHPYRMILEHHRALMRFANRTTKGPRRLLLPAVAAGLALRLALAWVQRAVG